MKLTALTTLKIAKPLAFWRTAFGIALRAESGCSGSAVEGVKLRVEKRTEDWTEKGERERER